MIASDGRPSSAREAAPGLTPVVAARFLAAWGFLVHPDLPDRSGQACLLAALREAPTERHYDPETIEFWVTANGRGERASITRSTPVAIGPTFSWGPIRLTDRFGVSNEYLAFGGDLSAEMVAGSLICVFRSPAPILRRGGHSQGWDLAAQELGAFFGRLMVAVDFVPGFEQRLASAGPLARYAAFLADLAGRYRSAAPLRAANRALWTVVEAAERALRDDHPDAWADGERLLETIREAG